MSLVRYPRYKDSGVAWLGQIPEHWSLPKLRGIATFSGGGTPSRENMAFWNGPIPWVSPKDMKAERIDGAEESITEEGLKSSASSLLSPGRVLMVVRSGILKHTIPVAINSVPVSLNQDMKALSFDPYRCLPSFFLRWVQGHNDQLLLAWAKQGATVESIEHTYLADQVVPMPEVNEQREIVDFLDRETAKIDALVAEQRRLIELLKEKRQAVISHAVTKGLNPDAPLKPSGIDWLGDVPKHWEIQVLKRVFRSVDYGISDSLDTEGTIAVLRMGNIDQGRVKLDDLKYTDTIDPALLLVPGDLLYNRTNSLEQIGKVGLFLGGTSYPISFASYLVRLRVNERSVSEFFGYLLNTEGILAVARAGAFVAIGQCNLNPTRYGQINVAVPPRSEQIAIAAHISEQTKKIDVLMAEAHRGIDLLIERRSALISAAVTGHFDVRSQVGDMVPA